MPHVCINLYITGFRAGAALSSGVLDCFIGRIAGAITLTSLLNTAVTPKSLPVLSTEPVLRKAAVDRGIRFTTELYGCRQRDKVI